MKKIFVSLCMVYLFMLFVPSSLFGEIRKVFSIQEATPHIENWTEDTLVVFDIDGTLTCLNDPAFNLISIKMYHDHLFSVFLKEHPTDVIALAVTIPLITTPGELLEKETPAFIQSLQEKKIKTIALTAAMGGKIGDTTVEDRRISELLRVGIDFSHSFKTVGDLVFTNLNKGPLGRSPIYKKGMLLTNEVNKGDVLVSFLKTIDWSPKEIVFFDDRLDHLQNAKSALEEFNPSISFSGFHIRIVDILNFEQTEESIFIQKWHEVINQAKQNLF